MLKILEQGTEELCKGERMNAQNKQNRFRVGYDSENSHYMYEYRGGMILSSEDAPLIQADLTEEEAEDLAKKLNWQLGCYGETEADMEKMFLLANTGKYASERTMYAMSILSDVQEILARNVYGDETKEIARQWINKAKYFIGEVHSELREQGK